MTRHVILAYGRETEHRRATFAVLSFWAWYAGHRNSVRTVVFTDDPAQFAVPLAGLPVEYVVLSPEQLVAMRGPQNFVHRVKVAIIDQVFRAHPGCCVLFCDSDTFFVAEADQLLHRLRPGTSLMHLREYRLADAVGIHAVFNQAKYPRRLLALLDEQVFLVGATKQRFRQTQFSWNSGVLGLAPDIAALMPDVFALNDAFYSSSNWIMSEQIAFSLALQTKTRIVPSEQYVFHYWGQRQKGLMDDLLHALLASPLGSQQLAERLAQVRALTIKWWRIVELDKDREGALYAFTNGQIVAGVKCALKALLASPFNAAFAKDLARVIVRRHRARSRPRQPLRQ